MEDERDGAPLDLDILSCDLQYLDSGTIKRYPIKGPTIGLAILVGCGSARPEPLNLADIEACVKRDVEAMKRALESCSFNVHYRYDPNIRNVDSLIEEIPNLETYSVFLFYYSGHGSQRGIELSCGIVEYNDIVKGIGHIRALKGKPKVVIFDCCQNRRPSRLSSLDNSNTTAEANGENTSCAFKAIGPPPADTIICYAASPSKRAYGSPEGSIYSMHLANAIHHAGRTLSFTEIVVQVHGETLQSSRAVDVKYKLQEPLYYCKLNRQLVFAADASNFSDSNVRTESNAPFNAVMPRMKIPKGPVTEESWTFESREEIESCVHELGEGKGLFICYAPDPDNPFAEREQEEAIKRIFDLDYSLEQHGFKVTIDKHVDARPPRNWLRWYASRIEQSDYVLMVCSPSFCRLFSGEHLQGVTNQKALLLNDYSCAIYEEIQSGKKMKFIPVILHERFDEQSVPLLFRGGSVYHITEAKPQVFRYERDSDFERLVCRLAGIDREVINRKKMEKELFTLPQEGPVSSSVHPSVDIQDLKRMHKKGYKFVTKPKPRDAQSPFPVDNTRRGDTAGAATHTVAETSSSTRTHHTAATHDANVSRQPNPPPPSVSNLLPATEVPIGALLWLSERIESWKFLARYLKLEEHEIKRIEQDNLHSIAEQRYQMLLTWKLQNPTATLQTLGEALVKNPKTRHLLGDFAMLVSEV